MTSDHDRFSRTGNVIRGAGIRAIVAGVLVLAPACFAAVPALAQNSGMQELMNRVDRLQRELNTLQRQYYNGQPAPAPSASNPAPAAMPADAGDPGTAARNSVRISQLENELRRLTGRNEEIEHGLSQVRQRLDQLVADMDRRLQALEGGAPASASGAMAGQTGQLQAAPGPLMPNETPAASQPSAPPPASDRILGAPPRPLGTLPRDMATETPRGPDPSAAAQAPSQTAPQTPPQTASAEPILPPGTTMQQYDYALSLMLQKQDFAKAETALRAFVDQHPQDKLAGNAQYWLGETYFVRKNYQDAAFAFADAFQKYPSGSKAPDSLLKLGMSLAALDKKKEACTAYGRLVETFPQMNTQLKGRVDREQRLAKCK